MNRDTANAQHAAQKLDVGALLETVEAERAIKQEAFKQTTIVTDAIYRSATGPKKILLQKCNAQGKDCSSVEVDMNTHKIVTGPNGQVYVFNHGIMNTEREALDNAVRQSDPNALEQGVYAVSYTHLTLPTICSV